MFNYNIYTEVKSLFKSVTLHTNQLKPLLHFYTNILKLDVLKSTDNQFTVKVGESTLTFKESSKPAFYHFAFNIPGNKFALMKRWIKEKISFNCEEGRDEVYFSSFDADSIYFEDPSGNIIELIARRQQNIVGDLTCTAFLNISEIGIVTPYVFEVGGQLQDFGIPLLWETEINPNNINFLGRDHSFIVLVPPNRKWYFSKQKSKVYPLDITLNNGGQITLDSQGKVKLQHKDN